MFLIQGRFSVDKFFFVTLLLVVINYNYLKFPEMSILKDRGRKFPILPFKIIIKALLNNRSFNDIIYTK